jgi:hypothetical protein
MIATVPTFPVTRPARRSAALPTPTEVVVTWASIILVLLAFWYGVGVGASALWGHFAG